MLGGARSGKSLHAERLAGALGERVLYVATALPDGDPDLQRRVDTHQERRPDAWGTMEVGPLGPMVDAAKDWDVVLFDSLTLWVSGRLGSVRGEDVLVALEDFLDIASSLAIPFVLVSDEVGLGVVPETREGRTFRDVLGSANQRVAAVAEEVHLCVAGVGVRIK